MGISENVGLDVTFKILNSSTNKILNRSDVRHVNDRKSPNIRTDPMTSPEAIKSFREEKFKSEDHASKHESNDNSLPSSSMRSAPVVYPKDLVGRTFLIDKEGGQRVRARIVKALDAFEGYLARDSSRPTFV